MGAGLYGCGHEWLPERQDTKDNSGQECWCVQVCSNAGVQGCMASKAVVRSSCRGIVVDWCCVHGCRSGLLGRKGAGLQGYLGAGGCRDPRQRCRIAGSRV